MRGMLKACKQGAISYAFSRFRKPSGRPQASLLNRLKADPRLLHRLAAKILSVIRELFSPQSLFIFSSYTLGMIVMSAFARGTVARTVNLILHGSFLLR